MPSRRAGFTLIEALVVVSILGLLIALLLPAVRHTRESARRLECNNHLKQMGIALAQHHSVYQAFPSALAPRWKARGRTWGYDIGFSGLYDLLPFLDNGPLYNAVNNSITDAGPPWLTLVISQNATVWLSRVGTFLCPSDALASSVPPQGPNTYRFNVTMDPQVGLDPSDPIAKGAAFEIFKYLSASDFTDGLSQTVGMSERLLGSQAPTTFDQRCDF